MLLLSLVVVCGVVSKMLGSVYSLLPPSAFYHKDKTSNRGFVSDSGNIPVIFIHSKEGGNHKSPSSSGLWDCSCGTLYYSFALLDMASCSLV